MVEKGRNESKRNKSPLVAGCVEKAIESLTDTGTEPTFNSIMAHLRSRGVLSNHRSLRVYLDYLVESGTLNVRTDKEKRSNLRPRQVYSLSHERPEVEIGEKALIFHGLNWDLPTKSSAKAPTDINGVTRARLERGTLYGSLEDTIVENLARTRRSAGAVLALRFCSALLATRKVDREYLMKRAREKEVGELLQELLHEIDSLLTSPKPEVEDIKSLYEVRRWSESAHRPAPARSPAPLWSLLSPDELLDVVSKQLGLK